MVNANINEIKAQLSHYLQLVEKGEIITICKRNVPIAEIKPLASFIKKRQLGLGKGKGKVLRSFFDPLPKKELEGWAGKSFKELKEIK